MRILTQALPIAILTIQPAFAAPRALVYETPDGKRIGRAIITKQQSAQGRIVTETRTLFLKEDETPTRRIVERTRSSYGPDGQLRSVETRGTDKGRTTLTRISFASGVATIERIARGDSRAVSIALPNGTRLDGGEPLMASLSGKTSFPVFVASAPAMERMELEALTAPDGTRSILRTSWAGNWLRSATRVDLDAAGKIIATHQPMFGTRITIREVPPDQAKGELRPFGMDHAGLVKFPWRIAQDAMKGHIRYRFHFADAIRFPFPETGEQRSTATANDAVLDICARCGKPAELSEVERADALRSTAWMQADHPLLQAMAAPIRALPISDAEKMERLGKAARLRIKATDFMGHYSALEALQRGAGDCTEDAVALAALGRAAGIPTRVANGLVYTKDRHHGLSNVFMPHSWALAWIDGRWQSFDISVGGFDATHIALSIGDGDPRSITAASQLASLLVWENAVEVRKRP